MNKCSPEDLRQALKIVDVMKKSGIDFVPIPVESPEHKEQLKSQCQDVLDRIVLSSEG